MITDGQYLMRLVLFWRDKIPDDWVPIAPGKSRRIAAEIPITFGDAAAKTSVSEQSVLVRGYSAMVVSNDWGMDFLKRLPKLLQQGAVALTNLPWFAPWGVEKFTWDPQKRKLNSAWSTKDISCPNSIPTMSVASGLAYCIGQRNSRWTLEGIDWNTGESAFHKRMGYSPIYNSAYAATQVGPDREIVNGTALGVIRLRAK